MQTCWFRSGNQLLGPQTVYWLCVKRNTKINGMGPFKCYSHVILRVNSHILLFKHYKAHWFDNSCKRVTLSIVKKKQLTLLSTCSRLGESNAIHCDTMKQSLHILLLEKSTLLLFF